MKILITGSHFTPAQATIEELIKNPNIRITYLGRKHTQEGDKTLSAESQVLPNLGVKFIPIITGRLQRTLTPYTIPSLLKIPIGLIQAFYLVARADPDVVLSFGGYVSVPVVLSAWVLSKKIIIHEQTLVKSLSSQICSIFADKIAVSFPEKKSNNSDQKTVLTGNPMRREILEDKVSASPDIIKISNLAKEDNLPLILITGGNQGSHVINQTVSEILDQITKQACIIHQTGDSKFADFDLLKNKRLELKYPERYYPIKWLESSDMAYVLRNSDLTVSRAGVNTFLEMAYFGVPVIVIPFPYLYRDEQNVNAKYFADLGLAQVILQKNLSSQVLLKKIEEMLGKLKVYQHKAKGAWSVLIPDAARRLALEVMLIAQR